MDKKRKKSVSDDSAPPAKVKILTIDQVNEGRGLWALRDSHESSSEPEGERERSATPLVPIRSIRTPAAAPTSDGGSDDNMSKPSKSPDNLWDAILKQIQIISDEEANRAGEDQVPSKSQVQRYLGSCLRTATKRNLLDIIKKLIHKENVDPNDRDTNGTTSIMIAASQGNVAVLEFFLPISDLTLVDKYQFTVLHHAAKKNDERTFKVLLSAKAQVDINAQNKRGMTPLMIACTEGCEAVVKVLLDCPSVDVNIADSSEDTALLNACSKGNEAIVSMLLGHKDIQANKANSNKDTALMIASNEEHPGVVRLLLTRDDIDVNAQNADNYTALMCGCDKGNIEIVRSLLDHENIDINLEDSNYETALIWACDKDQPKVISMLLQREELDRSVNNLESIIHVVMKRRINKKDMGAVIEEAVVKNLPDIAVWLLKNEEECWDSEPGFHQSLFTIAAQECHVNVVRYLLEKKGVDVNHLDVNKNTALMLTADKKDKKEDSYALAQLLIKKGAEVNVQGNEGNTAMMLCCDYDRLDLVNLLLRNSNVDVNTAGKDLFTPLIIAARGNKEDILRALLKDSHIDVNKKGWEGKSALVNAAERGFHNLVRIMIQHPDIDVNSQDGGGYTALMWGADMGHPEVVRELMRDQSLAPNIQDEDGHTALTWAADKGFDDIVKMLLGREDLDINSKDKDGYNPFLCAAKQAVGVVRVLAEDSRTDVNVQDDDGASALHNAVERDLGEIVEYLLKHPRLKRDLKNKKGKTAEKLAQERSKKNKAKKIYELFKV